MEAGVNFLAVKVCLVVSCYRLRSRICNNPPPLTEDFLAEVLAETKYLGCTGCSSKFLKNHTRTNSIPRIWGACLNVTYIQ